MGLMDWLFGEFVDVIEWTDDTADTMVYRFERYGNEIKYGAKLVVRESQVAVFVNEGEIADVIDPGLYELETKNLPILTKLQHWDHGFKSPFKAEVYYCNTKRFVDLKWGTKNPIMLRDPEFDAVRLRAFGTYAVRISDPSTFIREITGTDANFTTDEISNQLRNLIVSRFASVIGGAGIPILDLAANYDQLSSFITEKIAPEFETYGLELTKILVENISLPTEVEQALDKRTSIGIVGGLDKYIKYQSGQALEKGAAHGSGIHDGIGIGAGVALGKQLGDSISQPQSGQAQTNEVKPPPIPDSSGFHIAVNNKPEGPYNISELTAKIQSGQITAETLVWQSGMQEWQSAADQQALNHLFDRLTPPPIPSDD
ncbi:MAG: SPFH domain-containing protein [Gammaproteobacteria bacterium]|nr:SPFH domain-containing protein [Gammaproteobacteria bacterium]